MNDLKQVFENPKQEKKLIQNTLELDSGWSGIMHWCLWQLNCLFKTTFYALGRHTNQSGIFELVLQITGLFGHVFLFAVILWTIFTVCF